LNYSEGRLPLQIDLAIEPVIRLVYNLNAGDKKLIAEGPSPSHRLQGIGSNPQPTKLHEKVAWFYRRLCEEYECQILP